MNPVALLFLLLTGLSAHAQVGGGGTDPIACFTQDTYGGTPSLITPVTVTFNPTCSYLPVAPVSTQTYYYQFFWNFGDGPEIAIPAGGPTTDTTQVLIPVTHTFVFTGTPLPSPDQKYTVTLRIEVFIQTNGTGPLQGGPTNQTSSQVHLSNVNFPPEVSLLVTSSPADGTLPYELQLTASFSHDEDGFVLWAAISWGDGSCEYISQTPPNNPVVTLKHTYTAPGIYPVTLSVIDNGRLPAATVLDPIPLCNDPQAALDQIRTFQTNSAFVDALVTSLATANSLPVPTVRVQLQPQMKQDYYFLQIPGTSKVSKGKFQLFLGQSSRDKFDVTLIPNVLVDSIANATVSITLGSGASALVLPTFTTDARGRFKGDTVKFSFNGKKRLIQLRLVDSTLATALKVTNATVVNGNVDVPIKIVINNATTLTTTARFAYNATAGGKGTGTAARTPNAGN